MNGKMLWKAFFGMLAMAGVASLASVIVSATHDLPARVPTHWDAAGRPNSFGSPG
jgi:hypothetical protein